MVQAFAMCMRTFPIAMRSLSLSLLVSAALSSASEPPPLSPPDPSACTCVNSCHLAGTHIQLQTSDGLCDDGGPGAEYADCAYGTDCEDCGPRCGPMPPPSPPSPPPPPLLSGESRSHELGLKPTICCNPMKPSSASTRATATSASGESKANVVSSLAPLLSETKTMAPNAKHK